jgi:hypothetical protein
MRDSIMVTLTAPIAHLSLIRIMPGHHFPPTMPYRDSIHGRLFVNQLSCHYFAIIKSCEVFLQHIRINQSPHVHPSFGSQLLGASLYFSSHSLHGYIPGILSAWRQLTQSGFSVSPRNASTAIRHASASGVVGQISAARVSSLIACSLVIHATP